MLDIGCFHGLAAAGRRSNAARVKQLLAATGVYLMYAMIRQDRQQDAGIDDADLALFQPELALVRRENGVNAVRGGRPSAWLTWERRVHP
jgi:hypothetical protein